MSQTKPTRQSIATEIVQRPEMIQHLVYVESIDSLLLYQETTGAYQIFSPEKLQEFIFSFVKEMEMRDFSVKYLSEIGELMKMLCYRKIKDLNHDYVALKDCLFCFKDFSIAPHDPQIVTAWKMPFSWPKSPPPAVSWLSFLHMILVKKETQKTDENLIAYLQEAVGFLLLPELHPSIFFVLFGEGNNGKSVFSSILEALFPDLTSHLSLETVTNNRFAMVALIGKKINICSDDESKFTRADKLKALVSGDGVMAEHKYGKIFTFYPKNKYLFSSNQIPTFDSFDNGLRRRIKIIPFHHTFTDREKRESQSLIDDLKKELPAIFLWAVAGARRLREQNYIFTESGEAQDSIKEFEDEVSSAVAFFRENYEADIGLFCPNIRLFAEYREWCEQNGKKAMNSYRFHKDICHIFRLESAIRWDKSTQMVVRGKFCRRRIYAVPPPGMKTAEVFDLLSAI